MQPVAAADEGSLVVNGSDKERERVGKGKYMRTSGLAIGDEGSGKEGGGGK